MRVNNPAKEIQIYTCLSECLVLFDAIRITYCLQMNSDNTIFLDDSNGKENVF
jgi:hypothetical protein